MGDPWLLWAALLALLALAGAFSAGEVAVLSARPGRIEALVAEGRRDARCVVALQADPDALTLATALGRTLCLVLAGVSAAALAGRILPGVSLWLRQTGLLLVVVSAALVLGRLVPRLVASHHRVGLALLLARPLGGFVALTRFWSAALVAITDGGLRLLRQPAGARRQSLGPEALLTLLRRDEGESQDAREWELIRGVFRFSEAPVKRLMVPRPRVVALERDSPPPEVAAQMVASGFSRIPVYHESLDNVLGLVYVKDALGRLQEGQPIVLSQLLRPVHLVPESRQAGELLRELQRRRSHLAMVIDEHGSVTGLVTLEDLLEEIVGEIEDEHDSDEQAVERLSGGRLLVDGTLPIAELRERYAVLLPESGEYETVAGYLLERLGSVPQGGEVVVTETHRLAVARVVGHRIAQVRVEPLPGTPTSVAG
jgi:putative hemolysin